MMGNIGMSCVFLFGFALVILSLAVIYWPAAVAALGMSCMVGMVIVKTLDSE